jgi:lipoyl(octanoyl) transferase
MRAFTAARTAETADELWIVEHDPVFTQGIAGRDAHVLAAGDIPVVRTDRGGQVTYHGPGQVVAYPLVDLKRIGIYVKEYVYRIEEAVIDTLWAFGVVGHRVRTAPGIYVRLADPFSHAVLHTASLDPFAGLGKIAALGIKVSRHCTYHGVALNVAMDLEPYTRIDPCGYAGGLGRSCGRTGAATAAAAATLIGPQPAGAPTAPTVATAATAGTAAGRWCCAQSMISRRPSACSTRAVRLSTQSPSLQYRMPSIMRISAWWMWPQTTPCTPRERASRATAVSKSLT